jgi:hypothetical protein
MDSKWVEIVLFGTLFAVVSGVWTILRGLDRLNSRADDLYKIVDEIKHHLEVDFKEREQRRRYRGAYSEEV